MDTAQDMWIYSSIYGYKDTTKGNWIYIFYDYTINWMLYILISNISRYIDL